MRARVVATLVVLVIAIAVSASMMTKPLGTTPVVVELFTSQGCSSCPPADELLSELRHEPGVIPLAFHVDYWDNYNWRDPFSSKQWTQRQQMYVGSMKLPSAYTPQAVVNGRVQVVGSAKGPLLSAIEDASRKAAVGTLTVSASRTANVINAKIHADAPPNYNVVLVVIENGVATNIGGGENMGRKQTDDAIVRMIRRASDGDISIPIAPAWKNLSVVVFLQDRETLAIGNAAVASL